MLCPLCQHTSIGHYHTDKRRDYLHCYRCALVFVDPDQLPSPEQEKTIYDLHQNHPDDAGYLTFLRRLAIPLLERLPANSQGLDYGCGPVPVLAKMLAVEGHKMQWFDPLYHPLPSVHQQRVDFISCTEAIEHFHQPGAIWHNWMDMLNPGGCLAIMTKRVISVERFAHWHYKNDQTHVSFFSEDTFHWLATHHNLQLEVVGSDVVFLYKATV
ncbi:class I SAM-dependent methyltransferase [Bowmanella dokdonensis]|uniref:Class I SAM-dependent methyltransferase n=1 Tax=Bowmanella dokdonensis TaxID=751969 RepID=A0A939IN13_9ALTE|nr:class I SAM-dependent methyltransferase [Bowmanella dokdonensis]